MDQVVVRMRLEKTEGIHVRVGIFAGLDEDHLGKCGVVTFGLAEWEALRDGDAVFEVKRLVNAPKPGWSLTTQGLEHDILTYGSVFVSRRGVPVVVVDDLVVDDKRRCAQAQAEKEFFEEMG